MKIREELELLFKARIAVVNLVSYDEGQVLRELGQWARSAKWPAEEGLYTWDVGDQFLCLREPSKNPIDDSQQASPDNVLLKLDQHPGSATFVLKDFHQLWEAKPLLGRALRNLAARWPASDPRKNLILLTPERRLPVELKHDVPVLEVGKPDSLEMEATLRRCLGGTSALENLPPGLIGKVVEASLGLGSTQAERAFRKAVVRSRRGRLDESCIDLITEEKRAIIRESGALEYYPVGASVEDVGGLDVLRSWLALRRHAFGARARKRLDLPKGVALIGIPGTGKSLCAKVTASMWRQPLLRLDMGAVFGSLLGASERNLREAVQIAEVTAPCVLWVDEIEKGFAGSRGDGGAASRVLSTFLTWMQEKQSAVFVFATANDTEALPPEFLRKDRFDEVFFLDLPNRGEREDILKVHLRRKGFHDHAIRTRLDVATVAQETEGFVGAELKAVVEAASFLAFTDGERELSKEDLVRSAEDMVCLAESNRDQIEKLRVKVRCGQARRASSGRPDDEVRLDQVRGTRLVDVPDDERE